MVESKNSFISAAYRYQAVEIVGQVGVAESLYHVGNVN